MSTVLARLRRNLEASPSPDPEHPGLVLRDGHGYSDQVLLIPPQLVRTLEFFNGESTENDLREYLVRAMNTFDVGEPLNEIVTALSTSGFLENEVYDSLRSNAHQAFMAQQLRAPVFAGAAYPECPEDCRRYLNDLLGEDATDPISPANTFGVAAPHASFEGGPECYRDAFRALRAMGPKKAYIILATSHYGESERLGVTRKPYTTPLGQATPANELLDEIAAIAPEALIEEDYCHTMEHSAEFHVLWLQHLFGANVAVLPVLVGAFAHSIYGEGAPPESDPKVAAIFRALRHLDAKHGSDLGWVLSIDMAHMGARYGDDVAFGPGSPALDLVREKDQERIALLASGDIDAFWKEVQEDQDPLKWCGSAPLYSLYRAIPGTRAEALSYGQWNIDEESLVTFGALRFGR